jgi:hypothetical protein
MSEIPSGHSHNLETPFDDGTNVVLFKPLRYRILETNLVIIVPRGYPGLFTHGALPIGFADPVPHAVPLVTHQAAASEKGIHA